MPAWRFWEKDLFLVASGIVAGLIIDDLVFDYAESEAVTVTFYQEVLPSPVVTLIVPCLLAVLFIDVTRRLVTTGGSWRSLVLLAAFLAAAPYFEFVVKPAEGVIVENGGSCWSETCKEELAAALATVLQGHKALLALCIGSIILVSTEGPPPRGPEKRD